jgi:DNA-binding NtrC family response regulator
LSQMMRYRWPGNVRELRNYIERMVFLNKVPDLPGPRELANPHTNNTADIFADMFDGDISFSDAKQQFLTRFEREYLTRLLQRNGGNVLQSARAAKVDRRYLQRLKIRYGITVDKE